MTKSYDIDDCSQWEKYIANDIPTVPLWIGGFMFMDRSKAPFVVTNSDFRAVWYKDFFAPIASKSVDFLQKDRTFSSFDLLISEATHQAVVVAAKALKAAGYTTGRTIITTPYQVVDEIALVAAGARLGVDVKVSVDLMHPYTLSGASDIDDLMLDHFELASIVIPPTSNHEDSG